MRHSFFYIFAIPLFGNRDLFQRHLAHGDPVMSSSMKPSPESELPDLQEFRELLIENNPESNEIAEEEESDLESEWEHDDLPQSDASDTE